MPLPPVVIELSPRDVASEHASTLVEACSEAVRDGRCEVIGGDPNPDARAVAIVSSNDAYTQVRVELGLRRSGRTQWAVRVLDFGSEDPERERARTVGFVIGTLVGEAERAQASSAARAARASSATPAPSPASPKSETHPSPRGVRLRPYVELAPGVDTAFDSGAPRLGAALRVGAVLRAPWEAHLGGAYAVRPRDDRGLRGRWLTLEAGGGVAYPLTSALALSLNIAPFVERLDADVSAPRADSGGRWVYGVSWRGGTQLRATDRISLVLAGQLAARSSGTEVRVDGARVARQPMLSAGGSVGVRFQLF